MKTAHQGYKITQMTGGMAATVHEPGPTETSYTEINIYPNGISNPGRSFDIEGLEAFIEELENVLQLARNVDTTNAANRE